MKNVLIGVLVTIVAIIAIGGVHVAFNYDDIRSQFVGDDETDDENKDKDKEDDIIVIDDNKEIPDKDIPVIVDPSDDGDLNDDGFVYTYDVEVVTYEPDANYVGFRHCDAGLSTCEVLGIPAADFAKLLMGQTFTLSYNEIYGYGGGAAAGTSYSLISGDYELTQR